MTNSLNVVFAGTPQFAKEALARLLNSRHKVIAVYTQPDRPAGRGQQLTASPVKQLAQLHHLPVHQPASLRDPEAVAQLKALNPDVMVVAAYGLILPKAILDIPRFGCINIHASLLPRWRGAAPIQRAILAGDKETGISIMQMDEGLDTGDILADTSYSISQRDNTLTVEEQLKEKGADLLLKVLDRIDTVEPKKQSAMSEAPTYAKKITKEESQINWNSSAVEIDRQIRAFFPAPGVFTTLNGQLVKIGFAEVWQGTINYQKKYSPGEIIEVSAKEGIFVFTGKGVLLITELQLAGGKCLPVRDILNSKRDLFRLGNKFV